MSESMALRKSDIATLAQQTPDELREQLRLNYDAARERGQVSALHMVGHFCGTRRADNTGALWQFDRDGFNVTVEVADEGWTEIHVQRAGDVRRCVLTNRPGEWPRWIVGQGRWPLIIEAEYKQRQATLQAQNDMREQAEKQPLANDLMANV